MVAPAASGIFKQVRIATEATYGVAPGATGGSPQILRRVSSAINPDITTFKSNEIQPDRQLHTFRHGTQTVRGTLRGELSPNTYQTPLAALFAGTWTPGVVSSAIASTTAVPAILNTQPGGFSRGAGSFLADGFKLGDVVRLTGMGSTGAANNNRNYRITNLSALVMLVGPIPTTANPSVGNEVVAAVAGDANTVFTVVGHKLTMPDSIATIDPSFTLEEWFPDQSQSELYVGCKPTDARINIVPSAMTTMDMTWLGKGFSTGATAYFTSPTVVTTQDATTGVSGLVRIADQDLALVTAMQLNIMGGHTIDPVIGSVFTPFVFPGIIDVSGSVSLLFYDQTYFNLAVNETVVDIYLLQTLGSAINADFLNIKLENVKLNSVTKDDGPKAIIGTYSFAGIKYQTGGAGTAHDNGTVTLQDSTF